MKNKNIQSRKKGQSLVEFSLILPVLTFICFAGVGLAQDISLQIRMQNGAREGARFYQTFGYANADVYPTELFSQVRDTCSPSNISADGQIIVSIIGKFPTPPNTPPKLIILGQHFDPTTARFNSKIGTKNQQLDATSNLIPASFQDGDTVVAVEVFHRHLGIFQTRYWTNSWKNATPQYAVAYF